MATAEDIVSECFIRIWKKSNQFNDAETLKKYFYRSISNACKRWLDNNQRYRKHRGIIIDQLEAAEKPHIHNIIRTETIQLLRESFNTLPDRCRQVFIKLYIEERSVKEVAREMNTTISTVKNQQARGIKLLKPKLGSNR